MQKNRKSDFMSKVRVESDKHILKLKEQYEKNEIFENDLSTEEIKELIRLYENEEKELDERISNKKANIKRMLK